jgi:hypothetical protein
MHSCSFICSRTSYSFLVPYSSPFFSFTFNYVTNHQACAAISLLTAGDDSDENKIRIAVAGGCELIVSVLTQYGNVAHPAIVEKVGRVCMYVVYVYVCTYIMCVCTDIYVRLWAVS